eukprot:scaffold1738_cov73-Phaeocystis_antarctica.AAC.1
MLPAQHRSPHLVGYKIVRRHPHHPRRQRLEPLFVPPLRLGHFGAHLLCQHVDGHCRGLCPVLRANSIALLGVEEPLRSLHVVPRVGERCTERRTASSRPSAPRTRRPTPRRLGRAPPRSRDSAGASPHHPPPASAAPSPPYGTPRAASKRQGSPGS